jgi:hypothetical protein
MYKQHTANTIGDMYLNRRDAADPSNPWVDAGCDMQVGFLRGEQDTRPAYYLRASFSDPFGELTMAGIRGSIAYPGN